jgi:hypothetical protein
MDGRMISQGESVVMVAGRRKADVWYEPPA